MRKKIKEDDNEEWQMKNDIETYPVLEIIFWPDVLRK